MTADLVTFEAMHVTPFSLRLRIQLSLWIVLLANPPVRQLDAAPGEATTKIVASARGLLETLDDAQRRKLSFEFNDRAQRARWSNLPVHMAERRGLRMGDLKPNQRDAVMRMLGAALSPMGYAKVVGMVEANEVLKTQSGSNASSFGRDQYFVAFLGQPSLTEPWMIQFGGHHLGLNITMVGTNGVLTPSLIAVQPASFTLDGKTVRPLGRETDKAFELVTGLKEDQRQRAVLGFQMRDLALGPGHDGESIQPEGIPGSALDARQRQRLLELIAEWSGIIHETAAAETLREIETNLDQTWFAWSGPLEAGKAYFRVQGPTVIIEYAPQGMGGDVTQHLHTMYRDPTNDYGRKWVER